MTDVLFQLAAFLASAAGTIAGFGTSTILLPIAVLVFPFPDALFLAAVAHVASSLGRVTFFKAGLDRGLLARFALPSVLFSMLGASLVPRVPHGALQAALGGLVLAYAATALAGTWFGQAIVRKIPAEAFRKVVLVALVPVSLKLVHDGLAAWIGSA